MTKTKTKIEPDQDQPGNRGVGRCAGWVLVGVLVLVGALTLAAVRLFDLWPGSGDDPAIPQTITNPDAPLASFYQPTVMYWQGDIVRWAQQYGVNPNVIAIVVQIESCGHPAAISPAGATGLMQVMPFHFDDGDNMLNADINVQYGMNVFYECLTLFANWDLGLALACYNGGPSVTQIDSSLWAAETQYYYRWATGLWDDVVNGRDTSKTLALWLDAGGRNLCNSAAAYLYPSPTVTP
ncbi:MAG: transglycosylase SLT domain-containing protein [Anaerolineae bacterium]|nr:transglycosylase SLT domain-containing protein [Anaerolineae bacterium]